MPALAADVTRLQARYPFSGANTVGGVPSLRWGMRGLLERHLVQQRTSAVTLTLAALGPIGTATGALALVALVVVRRREAGVRLLRSRGASTAQLLLAQSLETVALLVPAALVATIVTLLVTPGPGIVEAAVRAGLVGLATLGLVLAATAPATRGRIVVIDMPGAGQAAVAVARNTLARQDPRYYRALVANAVLGGGYSARLNQEIRIRRGLSYGAGSSLDARRAPGPFAASVQTRNDAAAEVLGLVLGEMRRLGAEPISAAELTARRASLTGDFGRDMETTAGTAGAMAGYVMRGLGPDEIGRYLPGVLAVTPAEAQAAAAELLSPEGVTVVIVGEASQFLERLRRDHPDVIVIPLAELSLDSPTLRQPE